MKPYIKLNQNLETLNLKLDNETRLAACESGLSGKASVGHSHTLSDITDYTAPDLQRLIILINWMKSECREATIVNHLLPRTGTIGRTITPFVSNNSIEHSSRASA